MEMQISFSNRTWHLHTVPKLPVPGLRTMVSLFLIDQQTRLTLTLVLWRGRCDIIPNNNRPNNAEELKATIRPTWALITPEQFHRLIDSMPRRTAAVIQTKGAPTKYWVLYMLILLCSYFSVAKISKNPFFVVVLSNIQIFWDTEFRVFISCQL